MVMVKKGLKNSFGGNRQGDTFPWFKIKEGESKTIRFLTDGNEMVTWKRHYVKTEIFTGSVICLNDPEHNVFNCPLCKVASKDFDDPIGNAVEKTLAIVIDRTDPENAKLFEFTSTIKNRLIEDFDRNDTITDVDYSFKKGRNKKNNFIEYNIADIRSTTRALNAEEKKLAKAIDLDAVIKAYSKTKEEMLAMVAGANGSADVFEDADLTKGETKKEEPNGSKPEVKEKKKQTFEEEIDIETVLEELDDD